LGIIFEWNAFFEIEKNGLKINLSSFKEYYKISNINQLDEKSKNSIKEQNNCI